MKGRNRAIKGDLGVTSEVREKPGEERGQPLDSLRKRRRVAITKVRTELEDKTLLRNDSGENERQASGTSE